MSLEGFVLGFICGAIVATVGWAAFFLWASGAHLPHL